MLNFAPRLGDPACAGDFELGRDCSRKGREAPTRAPTRVRGRYGVETRNGKEVELESEKVEMCEGSFGVKVATFADLA